VAAGTLACVLAPQPAAAKVTCRFDLSTHILSVKSSGQLLDEPVLRRAADRIVVFSEFLGPRVPCAGSPTVTNTDRVELTLNNYSDGMLDLGGGPFAPGAAPEPGSNPEIEVAVAGSGGLFLEGGRHADHYRYLSAIGETGVNLNAGPGDRDVDLTMTGEYVELYVDGGMGDDLIDVVGHLNLEVAAFGGPGDDSLFSRHGRGLYGSLLEGGKGDDRIVGGAAGEGIYPGRGRDTVKAGAGGDFINAVPDGAVDRIDCGPGRDDLDREPLSGKSKAVADRFDRVRSCGRVKRPSPKHG
jgi:hypothetical protein